jgi:hypothetical protein
LFFSLTLRERNRAEGHQLSCEHSWLAAVPIALGLLRAVPRLGAPDVMQAVTTGLVIPPLVFGLGVLFLPPAERRSAPTP